MATTASVASAEWSRGKTYVRRAKRRRVGHELPGEDQQRRGGGAGAGRRLGGGGKRGGGTWGSWLPLQERYARCTRSAKQLA